MARSRKSEWKNVNLRDPSVKTLKNIYCLITMIFDIHDPKLISFPDMQEKYAE